MQDNKQLKEGCIYAVLLTDIDTKSIKYVNGSYGKWKNDLDWTIKQRVQEGFKENWDFSEMYTLVKYIGDNQFEEYYTSGEVPIYLSEKYEYENDNVDKFLFIDQQKLKEANVEVFKGLESQEYDFINRYLRTLEYASKIDIERRIKSKLDGDYISALGENLYYDYVHKKTK